MIREFISVSVANITLRFSGLIIVPFLSNSFTIEEMGLYDVVWTAIIFFELFFGFKLTDACYRYSLKANNPELYFGIGFGLIATISILTLCLLVPLIYFLLIEVWDVVLLGALIVISKLFMSLFFEFLRAKEDFVRYRRSGVLITSGYIINCFGQVYFNDGFSVTSFYVGFLAVNLLYIFNVLIFNRHHFKNLKCNFIFSDSVGPVFIFGIKLLPSAISWWFLRFSQRWLVMLYLGVNAVAVVTISSYPFLVFTALSTYMYMAAQRSIFKWHDGGEDEGVAIGQYRILRSIYLLLAIGILVLVDVCSVYLFPDDLYDSQAATICIFGGIFMSLGSYLGNVYMGQMRVVAASITSVLSAFLAVITAYWAIGFLGVVGFSIGMFVGGIALFLLRLFDPRVYKTFFSLKQDLFYYLTLMISFIVLINLSIYIKVLYLLLLVILLVLMMYLDGYGKALIMQLVNRFVMRCSK